MQESVQPSAALRAKPNRKRKTVPTFTVNHATLTAGPSENEDLNSQAVPEVFSVASESEEEAIVPAVLSFNFEEAKRHLIQVDSRFEELFTKMACKPFEYLEQVHPFR